MTSRLRSIAATLVIGLLLLAPAARADTYDDEPITEIYLGLAAVFCDIGLSVADLRYAYLKKPPPVAYGVVETLLALPQVVLFSVAASSYASNGESQGVAPMLLLTAWTAGLTAHGLHTIFRERRAAEPEARRRAGLEWRVAPTLVATPTSPVAAGAMVFGTF